ncbi:MAG: inorganic phosphate transporter [Chloroflexota bacterium]
MPEAWLPLVLVLVLVLAAEFVNGWTDAPNAIATVVSTRVLSPQQAVTMASVLNVVGALATGTAVAATVGKGIIRPETVDLSTVAAAMSAIVIWSTLNWRLGLPTSESHALVAGLAGAGLATSGPGVLLWQGWQKVIIGLGFSTLLGFGVSLTLMVGLSWLLRHANPIPTRKVFGRLQVLSSAFMAFSHGSNDGQKFMGVFALALLLGGKLTEFHVPVWVVLLCGVTMGLGTMFGGWRILKTVGFRLTRLEPVHGFAAETSAAFSILLASRFGIPLSTTHTIGTSIMGVGASRRFSAVRWGITRQIVLTWLLTFPACAVLGALLAWLFKAIF